MKIKLIQAIIHIGVQATKHKSAAKSDVLERAIYRMITK